jgi:hypothetical protein
MPGAYTGGLNAKCPLRTTDERRQANDDLPGDSSAQGATPIGLSDSGLVAVADGG